MYRYHHLHLICSDLERTLRFFCDEFGARLVRRRKFGTAEGAVMDLNGCAINLRVAREGEEIEGDSSVPRYGYDHLGLEVDDLEAAYKELSQKGYPFPIPPTESDDVWYAFMKGPDGITIELVERK
jgi:catechol 2,3-dioxygenase-like lactoylglutathione lyase family enzyme